MGDLKMTSVCRVWAAQILLLLLLLQSAAQAQAPTAGSASISQPDRWTSSMAQTSWYFNQDLLVPLGIKIVQTENAVSLPQRHRSEAYKQFSFASSTQNTLEVAVRGKQLTALSGGGVQHAGGFVLQFAGGAADLRGFVLQPVPGSDFGMQIADSSGRIWFRLDHPHYALSEDGRILSLSNMSLRLSAQFAAALGRPEFANMVVGALDSTSMVRPVSATAAQNNAVLPMCANTYAWQSPTHPADIALIYGNGGLTGGVPDQINFERCKIPNGAGYSNCTPDSTNGWVVLAPDASLQNIGTSSVAWNAMFNLNNNEQPQPPYNNDQHPYLVWNLYRVDANGAIKQIGVSAAKHAFYSVNYQCGCDPGHSPSVVYPTCQDNYSGATNDFDDYLGPRSEIVPATGRWGRCGSIFDPTCSGKKVPGTNDPQGSIDPQRHMLVLESDITPALNPGAQYYFEYWYVVRDDLNVYNSMGYRAIENFRKVLGGDGISSIWQFDTGALINGPYINTWIPPPETAAIDSDNVEIATPEGHARIAVRTYALGNGMYHYDYAVMNIDFAHAVIDPAHPTDDLTADPQGLKLLSSIGFNRFSVPIGADVNISNLTFADADANATNDWTSAVAGGHITWQAPDDNALNWGTLYAFGFDADHAPNSGNLALALTQPDSPLLTSTADTATEYSAMTLAPVVTSVEPTVLPTLNHSSLFAIAVLLVLVALLRRRRNRI